MSDVPYQHTDAGESIQNGSGERSRRLLARMTIALWCAGSAILCAYLLAGHLLTLPSPKLDNAMLSTALASSRAVETRGQWIAVHFLYEECGCSQKVFDHLIARGAHSPTAERIVFVGVSKQGDLASAKRARDAGFAFEVVSNEQLHRRYAIESAPLLVVADADSRPHYVGGYTDRKQAPIIRDLEIIERVTRNEIATALPVFGCAVSENLRRQVDPLGVRK